MADRKPIQLEEILPPDPYKDPRIAAGEVVSVGNGVRSGLQSGSMTPGMEAWKRGESPRQLRRRMIEQIRTMAPDAMVALKTLMKGEHGNAAAMSKAAEVVLSYSLGKPGDMQPGADDDTESRGSIDVRLLTPDERGELHAALQAVARLSAIAKGRAASE